MAEPGTRHRVTETRSGTAEVHQSGVGLAVVQYRLAITDEFQQGTRGAPPVRVSGRIAGVLDILRDDVGIVWQGGAPLTLVTEHSERFAITVPTYTHGIKQIRVVGSPELLAPSEAGQ